MSVTARPRASGGNAVSKTTPRIGVIVNTRSHRNQSARDVKPAPEGVETAYTETLADVAAALKQFAAQGIDLLVIDGGDGTIRDVLSLAAPHFGEQYPRLAVLPSGKTNALAVDLGVPKGWTLDAALACHARGEIRRRAPLEIWRKDADAPEMRGFLLGAAAFVRATQIAQGAHKLGAFDALGVAAAIGASLFQALLGGPKGAWRAGESIGLALGVGPMETKARFLVLTTTLKRFPMGFKPFGPPREGLKVLHVDAPPRRLPLAMGRILTGRDAAWLPEAGYHQADVESLALAGAPQFVLDGDLYPGGEFAIRRGPLLEFAAPT